jgi:hypothetical protein
MADLTTRQCFQNIVLVITDANGAPAAVDGAPVWTSSDETVVVAVASADGLTGTINSVAVGTARVTVTADADLGSGVVPLSFTFEDINVTLDPRDVPMAANITAVLPAAVDKP